MEEAVRKKLSAIITIRLLVSVLAAFAVSSAVTYIMLVIGADEAARDLVIKTGLDIAVDVRANTENGLVDNSEVMLYVYHNEGEEAARDMLSESAYSYFAHLDGTIFISGKDDFIGRNIREIEGVDSAINNIASFYEAWKGNAVENSYTLFRYVSLDPVKTLDGETEVYYVMVLYSFDIDVIYIEAYSPETYERYTVMNNDKLATNRHVGYDGFVVVTDSNKLMISGANHVVPYDPVPNGELIDTYISGNDNRIVTKQVGYTNYFVEGNTYKDHDIMVDKAVFWDEEYYYALIGINGIYIFSLYPVYEAMSSANSAIVVVVIIEVIVFAVLFAVLQLLIKRKVVRSLDAVNASLAQITGGNLEEKVNVRDSREFYALSRDINSTVDRLKEYIAEAAARLDADLAIAKAIQISALPNVFPPFPERREFELYASMNAAKEVGGDFYDFYMLGENTLGFLIADVSGKSIPGAMFMMTAKTVIKSLAQSGLPPAEVFTQANEKLCEGNEAEMFVTAWLGYLDLKTGLLRAANAGHNPPVLIRDGKAEYVIMKPGLMLAGMDGVRYREQTLQLEKGDMLYLYTDGVTEAMDRNEEQYGEERLKTLLSFGDNCPAPCDDNGTVKPVCDAVISDVAKFTAGAEQSDDITMLCIKFSGED